MELFIGLDVGTSAVKGILVSARGRKIAVARRGTDLLHPQPGWTELEPEEHVRTVFGLIAELASHAPPGDRVAGLSMAFASGNVMFVDAGGRPLYNIFSWLDGRSVGRTEELLPDFDRDGFHAIVGWPFTELFPLVQIAWFRRHHPREWGRLARVCMNNDYLSFRLTGRWGLEPSTATTFYLQDQVARRWHTPYLDLLGIDEEMLSPLLDSGEVLGRLTPGAAEATGLREDTAVVLGAFDHPCAARGTGTLDEGELLLSCGTSWVDYYPLHDRDLAVAQKLLVDPFLSPGGPWGCMAALTAVGVTIDRYIESAVLPPGEDPSRKYELFNAAAQEAPPGAGGLFLDLYRDNRTFLEEAGGGGETGAGSGGGGVRSGGTASRGETGAGSRGSGPGANREQVARALMEAAAFELKRETDRLAAAGIPAGPITMVGGPTESPIWPRIVAEVAGLPLRLINGQTAGAMGAAMLAAVGCGLYRDEQEAFAAMGGSGTVIEPEQAAVERYADLYGEFRRRLGK
jgi:xylulokinase